MGTLKQSPVNSFPKYMKPDFVAALQPKDFTMIGFVECFPLFSLLTALNVTEVDYLSLDVQGPELKILKTIPYEKVNIKVR